jgi:hypothetical protein
MKTNLVLIVCYYKQLLIRRHAIELGAKVRLTPTWIFDERSSKVDARITVICSRHAMLRIRENEQVVRKEKTIDRLLLMLRQGPLCPTSEYRSILLIAPS